MCALSDVTILKHPDDGERLHQTRAKRSPHERSRAGFSDTSTTIAFCAGFPAAGQALISARASDHVATLALAAW